MGGDLMTIYQIMNYINNFFVITNEANTFTLTSNKIYYEDGFEESYVTGQYVLIKNSIGGDGVYKVISVTSDSIFLDTTFSVTESTRNIDVYGLAVPPDFIALVNKIIAKLDSTDYGTKRVRRGDTEIEYEDISAVLKQYNKYLSPYRKMRWNRCP